MSGEGVRNWTISMAVLLISKQLCICSSSFASFADDEMGTLVELAISRVMYGQSSLASLLEQIDNVGHTLS